MPHRLVGADLEVLLLMVHAQLMELSAAAVALAALMEAEEVDQTGHLVLQMLRPAGISQLVPSAQEGTRAMVLAPGVTVNMLLVSVIRDSKRSSTEM